jgi:hypothetical protein
VNIRRLLEQEERLRRKLGELELALSQHLRETE